MSAPRKPRGMPRRYWFSIPRGARRGAGRALDALFEPWPTAIDREFAREWIRTMFPVRLPKLRTFMVTKQPETE